MNPEEKKLSDLGKTLAPHQQLLGQASDTVIHQNVSKYPIFVASEKAVQIGIPILNPEELKDKWFLYISTLEEFATKNLISMDKVDNFRSIYKSPSDQFCIFLIEDIGATFVFLPRV